MRILIPLRCALVSLLFLGQAFASDITIAETVRSDGPYMSTRFQVINDRFEPASELLIRGVMPRLSPNRNKIAYVENSRPVMRFALMDLSGNNVVHPPFLLENHIKGWQIAGLEWSPDSSKIVFILSGPGLSPGGHPVQLVVYDLTKNQYGTCFQSNASHSEGAYFQLTARWFPDNQRLLIQDNLKQGNEKIVIADPSAGTQRIVYEGASVSANIVHNGKEILIINQEGRIRISFNAKDSVKKHSIFIYHIEKEQISEVAVVSLSTHYSNRHLISVRDSEILILPGDRSSGENLTLVNITSKKIDTIQHEMGQFFPQAVSPNHSNWLCGLTENGYGVLNTNTLEFKTIRSFSKHAVSGEDMLGAVLFFNRIEWVQ